MPNKDNVPVNPRVDVSARVDILGICIVLGMVSVFNFCICIGLAAYLNSVAVFVFGNVIDTVLNDPVEIWRVDSLGKTNGFIFSVFTMFTVVFGHFDIILLFVNAFVSWKVLCMDG